MPYPKSYLPRSFRPHYVDYRPVRGLISRELHERVGQRILEVNGLVMPLPPRLPLPGSEDPLAILAADGPDDDEEDTEGETLMSVTRRYFGD